jgi:hypothetical protein
MGALQQITTDFTTGSKNSAADWFTDITADFTGTLVGAIVVATTCVPKFTQDGTNFYNLNGGNNITASSWYMFTLPVKIGDTLNLHQASGSAVTVSALRLYK